MKLVHKIEIEEVDRIDWLIVRRNKSYNTDIITKRGNILNKYGWHIWTDSHDFPGWLRSLNTTQLGELYQSLLSLAKQLE